MQTLYAHKIIKECMRYNMLQKSKIENTGTKDDVFSNRISAKIVEFSKVMQMKLCKGTENQIHVETMD